MSDCNANRPGYKKTPVEDFPGRSHRTHLGHSAKHRALVFSADICQYLPVVIAMASSS